MKMSGQLQAPAAVNLRKNPGTHRLADRVGPSSGLNGLALPGLEPRSAQPVAYSVHSAISCPDFRIVVPLKEIYAILEFV